MTAASSRAAAGWWLMPTRIAATAAAVCVLYVNYEYVLVRTCEFCSIQAFVCSVYSSQNSDHAFTFFLARTYKKYLKCRKVSEVPGV